jgi:hypothetical protein
MILNKLRHLIAGGILLGAGAMTLSHPDPGGFCVPRAQTRVACENHTGHCQFTAWNYKIYYLVNYECCYNSGGQYTHKHRLNDVGPTSTVDGDCCQNLEAVTFADGKWTLPCEPTATPPVGGG